MLTCHINSGGKPLVGPETMLQINLARRAVDALLLGRREGVHVPESRGSWTETLSSSTVFKPQYANLIIYKFKERNCGHYCLLFFFVYYN